MYKLWIVIMVLALIIVYLIIFISVNGVVKLKDDIEVQEARILYMEQKLLDKDFAWIASDMQVENLEEIIMELRVKEEMYEYTKEMLEYSLTYIHFVQTVMDRNGLIYPEFIIESVLSEEFIEEYGK